MKTRIVLFYITLALLSCSADTPTAAEIQEEKDYLKERTQKKAREALSYCKEKGFDTSICFLLDMNLHSGKNRFFVYDLKGDSIQEQSMVSHGCGNKPWSWDWSKEDPVFSNTPDSHLSSLGKYKVGKRGYSNWGIHVNYKLHGLDSTNSNAYKRFIVLHSWDDIPNEELYPDGCPEGWGCPAVSNDFMHTLDAYLKATQKPVLLWIYRDE